MKDRQVLLYAFSQDAFSNKPQPVGLKTDFQGNLNVRVSFFSTQVPLDGLADNSDLVTPSATANKVPVVNRLTAYDPTNNFYRRVSARATNALNVVSPSAAEFGLDAIAVNMGFDGTFYRPMYLASAANMALQSGEGVQMATQPGEWAVQHQPAVNTQATVSKAAGGAGVRHVCKGFTVTLNAVAAVAAPLVINLRDGGTGAGTVLWSTRVTAPAGQTITISRDNLNIIGSANTAMTLEFAAAPGATNFEDVSMNGITVSG